MEYRTLKLGREPKIGNDIVINDPAVSAIHLSIDRIDDQYILITDQKTTNRTRVNGNYVVKAKVGPNDIIHLGQSQWKGSEIISKCQKLWLSNKVVFYDEFKELENHFKEYEKEKLVLNNRNKYSTLLIRVGIPVTLMIILIKYGDSFGISQTYSIVFSMIFGGISQVIAVMVVGTEKMAHSMKMLYEKFKPILICPKCNTKLIDTPVEVLKNQRRCDVCQAAWVV
jgi:pSer/pThr/pTyr-binding forkhead associated (FHA) protein